MARPTIALALGSGGARGFAHLGVLEVLDEHDIPIDMVLGASIGSIVGAFYADFKDVSAVKDILLYMTNKDLLNFSLLNSMQFFFSPKGPFKGEIFEEFIAKHLSVDNIEDLDISYIPVAVDLQTGHAVGFTKGDLGKAVHASCALPPLFSPLEYQGRSYIDGGFVEPVPVQRARDHGADFVIAVDISSLLIDKKLHNMVDVLHKSRGISDYWLSKAQAVTADCAIYPALDQYDIFADNDKQEIYLAGKRAAQAVIPQLLNALSEKS